MPKAKSFDVLGLGCAAIDEILYVHNYPAADAKIRVLRRERHCGGLTATALVTASRLGMRCAYAGTLGNDSHSEFVIESMRREKIDVRGVVRRSGARPVQSVVIVDEERHTRNVFADVAAARGADPHRPARELIAASRVLFIDHFGIAGNIRAARIARQSGVPIVSDLEHGEDSRIHQLLTFIDHPIFSRKAAQAFTGEKHPARAAAKLWRSDREAVVVTCGADGVWVVSREHPTAKHLPAFAVTAADTTGCGDVFHGAYAAGLARGWNLEERLLFASATAALKATKHGGQSGIPRARAVQRFLSEHDRPGAN